MQYEQKTTQYLRKIINIRRRRQRMRTRIYIVTSFIVFLTFSMNIMSVKLPALASFASELLWISPEKTLDNPDGKSHVEGAVEGASTSYLNTLEAEDLSKPEIAYENYEPEATPSIELETEKASSYEESIIEDEPIPSTEGNETSLEIAICRLVIPSCGIDTNVFYDESYNAPDHYDVTMDRFQGEIGNQDVMTILGHNTGTFGALHTCKVGETIQIITGEKTLTYKIVESDIGKVSESGTNILTLDSKSPMILKNANPPTTILNLYTCYGYPDQPYYAGDTDYRYVVRAELIDS